MREFRLSWKSVDYVRHARSLSNETKRDGDFFADDASRSPIKDIPEDKIPLVELGLRQAPAAGKRYRDEYGVPDVVLYSGYLRTKQTLDLFREAYTESERNQMQIVEEPMLREHDRGYTRAMTHDEVARYFPWFPEHERVHGEFYTVPPGGESIAQVLDRVNLFFLKYQNAFEGKRVLHVSHGRVLSCMRMLHEAWSIEQMVAYLAGKGPRNCSLYRYENGPDGMKLVVDKPYFCGVTE